jgi:hypothetical protein
MAGSPLATDSGRGRQLRAPGNTLTIDGGAVVQEALNRPDSKSPVAGIATNAWRSPTGDGDFNTVNIASDARTNTGDMTGITSAIVVNAGAGVSNVVNMVDTTDPNGVKAMAANSPCRRPNQNGVVYTDHRVHPASIAFAKRPAVLSANLIGSLVHLLNFNLLSDSIIALAITTGDIDQNHVVLGSTAPLFTGNVDNILSRVTANFGAGILNTFIIADQSGIVPFGVLLENDATGTYNQVTGYASPLIQYSAVAGGHLDVLMFAANTVPTTFTVGSTLGTGTTLELDGGTNGSDTFNVQGAAADTVTVNTGNGKNNAVNISSTLRRIRAICRRSATTQLTVNGGTGSVRWSS